MQRPASVMFVVLVLTLGAAAARADPETLYLGAGITHNSVSNFAVANANPENTVDYPNISATSWKALLGFRPIRAFAIELDYFGQAGTLGPFPQGRNSQLQGYGRTRPI